MAFLGRLNLIALLLFAAFEVAAESYDTFPPYGTCYGGGINLASPEYSVTHLFESYRQSQQCKPPEEPKKIGGDYHQARATFDRLAEALAAGGPCLDFGDEAKAFIQKRDQGDKMIKDYQERMIGDVKDKGRGLNLQQENSHLALVSAYCSNSHIGYLDMVYWEFIVKLIERVGQGIETRISRDGETAQDCRNVVANGEGNLKNFFVSLQAYAGGPIKFKYITYTVPDQFEVWHDGKKLFESQCQRSNGMESTTFGVSLPTSKPLEVRVKGNCQQPDLAYASVWELKLSCGPQEETGPCGDLLRQAIAAGKAFIASSLPMMNHYWMQVLCYADVYKNVFDTFKDIHKFMKVLQSGGVAQQVKVVPPVPTVPALEFRPTQEKETQKGFEGGPNFNIRLPVFEENIDYYCTLKPGDKESIFKRVSWAYCYYGFKRLKLFQP